MNWPSLVPQNFGEVRQRTLFRFLPFSRLLPLRVCWEAFLNQNATKKKATSRSDSTKVLKKNNEATTIPLKTVGVLKGEVYQSILKFGVLSCSKDYQLDVHLIFQATLQVYFH